MEKPILIQGAMHQEISLLLERLGSVEETTHEGFPFWSGVWEKIPVVVSKTYAGKINAALATVTGIRTFAPGLVLNQGTAGAHRPDLEIGDIIIGKRYINYDAMRTLQPRREGEGYSLKNRRLSGELFDGFGWKNAHEILAREELVGLAVRAADGHDRIMTGTIATGDGFNREADAIRELRGQFGSDCEEMETFAAAQVCGHYGVPFLGIRVISNNELQGCPFDADSCTVCQDYVLKAIRAFAKQEPDI